MKPTILFIAAFLFALASCNSNGSSSVQDTTPAMSQTSNENRSLVDTLGVEENDEQSSGGNEKGRELISKSDCLTCHKENDRLIGPAYAEVAKKYENNAKNIEYLAGKIIEGGSGVWGEIPMTPHPDLSKDDAAEMAKYVLSIK